MCRNRHDQFWHDNVVDACIFIAMSLFIAAGCASAPSAPPQDGEYRVLWQKDSAIPRPIVVQAHVPYPDAGPDQTSYTPVTP